jgi:serine/threonine protein kinase
VVCQPAIAALYGFKGGVILHSDIHLHQILLSKKGVLKLNDFDSNRILSHNAKTSEHCTTCKCKPQVRFFSPEQAQCDGQGDEKMDVWVLGTNINLLLTGLWPFYGCEGFDLNTPMQVQPRHCVDRSNQRLPFADERHRSKDLVHSNLVGIMELC